MKAKKLSKKLISIILTIMMLATMLPATSVHTHAAVDNSGVTLEYSGTEVVDSTIINNTNQKVKAYTITDNGEYVLKTSSITQYGVAIILDAGASDIRLILDNVNIDAQIPIMPDTINGINYNNAIQGGLAIYNSGDELSNLDIYIKGSNTIRVSGDEGYTTSALIVRDCNTVFYGDGEDNKLDLSNSSAITTAYGLVNLTKDGYVGGSVSFEIAPFLGFYEGANVSVDVQQGEGIITARDINMFNSRLFVHSYGVAIQSYVDEGILENGYYGLYVENSTLSVDSSGAGIGINNGGAAFFDGTDVTINSTSIALTVCSGNIIFGNINNAYISSNDGYGLSLNDSTLSVDFNSDNVSIYGERYAIMGMPQYVTTRGFVGDNEIITLHSDDGIDYSEYTDDVTTKKYVKTSTRAHTHDFGEDYYESDVAGNHYMLCACGEMSELEECTYSFSHFKTVPGIDNDGIKVSYCDYCGSIKEENIPAHDCNAYTDFEIDDFGNHYGYCTYVGCERFIDEPHNLELLEELDENSHKHICAACGYYEAEDHLFVEFELIDEDTHEAYCECGYTGVKPHEYFEFSGNNDGETHTGYCYCGAEITGDHNWSDWSETGNGHMRTCDVCGAEEHGAHQWDDWYGISMVQHQHECQVCHKLENVDHEWDDWVNKGEAGHSHDCLDCGWRITEDHEYAKCGDNGDGTHTKYCFCGATVTEEHNWGDWEEAADGLGHIRECADCSAEERGEHQYDEWYGISMVQHQHECQVCHKLENVDHEWDDWVNKGEAGHSHDCLDCGWRITEDHEYAKCGDNGDGTHTKYCFCGATVTEEHNWGDWEEAADGSGTFHTCNDCHTTEYCSHEWSEWYGISNLHHQHQCDLCGSLEDGRHTWGNWTDLGAEHSHECSGCGWRITEEHSFGEYIDDENGETHTSYCTCHLKDTRPHDWCAWVMAEDGSGYMHSCNTCGAVEYCQHSWGDWVSVDEYTHRRECSECGAYETGSHSLGSVETHDETNHKYACSTCEYFETENHNFEFVTDDLNGETHTEKCMCGEMHSVAHDYTSHVVDIDDGINHNAYCECGAYTAEEHVYNTEFSDSGDGTHYVHCLCGAYTIQEHTYDQVIVTREPVDGMPGEKQHTCQCGATCNSTEFISYVDINDDGVIDVEDYQFLVNEALSDGNEQSGTAEYDEIIKYDLDGDGYVDVLDCALMALIVNSHKTFGEVQNTQKGDYDLDGEAFTESDLIAMYHVLSDIEGSAPTLSTSQKFASDLNCNGKIDEDDLTILVETYGTIEATTCEDNVKVYYRWGNSYTTCTATAICTICDKHVAKETVNSVNNADGSYTATFTNTLLGTKTYKK